MAKDFTKISNTPPRYRFKLSSIDGGDGRELVLNNSPLEWESSKLEIERRMDVGGVFVNYNITSLTFIKEGFQFIKSLFDQYELNAKCDLYVYEFDFSTRLYNQFPAAFALNFSTYKLVKSSRTDIQSAVNIKAVNSSEMSKFDNRKDIDVDLTKLVSVGGFDLIDWTDLKSNINTPEVSIINFGKISTQPFYYSPFSDFFFKNTWYKLSKVRNRYSFVTIPTNTISSDFVEMKNMVYQTGIAVREYETDPLSVPIDASAVPFFDNALFNYVDIKIDINIAVMVTDKHSFNVYYPSLIRTDSDRNMLEKIELIGFGSEKTEFTSTFSNTISIDIGEKLFFMTQVNGTDDIEAFMAVPFVQITQEIVTTESRTIQSLPIYEALERNLQLILDKQFPFYSEYLGRLDTPYNLAGSTYLSEDSTRFLNVMSGLNIRGGLLHDDNVPVPSNFKDLFHAANSIYNLGYTFEEIESVMRLRIENYSYFFQDEIILDISTQISQLDIQSEVLPELAYLDIQTGYKKYEYEEINGRGEFNTTNKRTSIINTDTKFDNVSKVRADSKGIFVLLDSPIETTGSTDVSGDNELFFIKTQRDSSAWKPEKEEIIQIIDNSSIFGSDTFNLYITPTRNLLRHGSKLKTSLVKYDSSYLRFQTSDKLQTLETTGEGYQIRENADILVAQLTDPIYKPIAHTVSLKLSFDQRNTLLSNPLKRIKFTETISGWILKYSRKNNEDKVEITIIEKYV